MSLATRCTACGTIFRVVQDQLRVSEGWVRCGRCAEVFDAREQLFDIDREPPPYWPGDAIAAEEPEEQPPVPPPAPEPPPPAPPVFIESDPPAPAPAVYAAQEQSAAAEEELEAEIVAPPSIFPDSRQEPRWVDEDTALPAPTPPAPIEVEAPPPFSDESDESDESDQSAQDVVLAPTVAQQAAAAAAEPAAPAMPIPDFMRRAQNGERWRRPGVRAALGAGLALSLALLALQVGLKFHDAIVALYPQARPAMAALCEIGGCSIGPWRRIDAVSVEASALNQAGPNNQYQLTVNLRNKSGVEVATPWIELSLNDGAGALVARRMLSPADFQSSKPSLPAGTELPLQAMINTGKQRVAGYTLEIFHP